MQKISTRKKPFLKRIRELEQENQQYRVALQYALFDLEATRRERDEARRERDEARRELNLLRESLLGDFEGEI